MGGGCWISGLGFRKGLGFKKSLVRVWDFGFRFVGGRFWTFLGWTSFSKFVCIATPPPLLLLLLLPPPVLLPLLELQQQLLLQQLLMNLWCRDEAGPTVRISGRCPGGVREVSGRCPGHVRYDA